MKIVGVTGMKIVGATGPGLGGLWALDTVRKKLRNLHTKLRKKLRNRYAKSQ